MRTGADPPTLDGGRDAMANRSGGEILRDDGPGADDAAVSYGDAAEHGYAGTEPDIAAKACRH